VERILPVLFIALAALALVTVLFQLWQSLRLVFAVRTQGLRGTGPGVPERDRLLQEKQELLTAIRDVRFEHELGKVSTEDFERLDQRYRARAREVLEALDEQIAPYRERAASLLDGDGAAPGKRSASESAPDDDEAVEAKSDDAGDAKPDASSADAGEARTAKAEQVTALKCGDCGTLNESDANFCKKCAASLKGGD
jgi:hypothetical protein